MTFAFVKADGEDEDWVWSLGGRPRPPTERGWYAVVEMFDDGWQFDTKFWEEGHMDRHICARSTQSFETKFDAELWAEKQQIEGDIEEWAGYPHRELEWDDC